MGVSIKPGDKDIANNFVDVDNCSTSSGLVTGDDDKQLFAWLGIVLQLLNPDGSVIATTTMYIKKGEYVFRDVKVGDYTVKEMNPSPEYP
jgi:hypothetical protein